jgi:hypothetical protein
MGTCLEADRINTLVSKESKMTTQAHIRNGPDEEECLMTSNVSYQLRNSPTANSEARSATGTTDLCGVLQSLLEDILAVYLKAEKVHWHLRLHGQEKGHLAGIDRLTHATDELCAGALSGILQLGCSMQDRFSGEDDHFAQLINAVVALHARPDRSDASGAGNSYLCNKIIDGVSR